ncbi:MAG: hypothetical protein FWD57_15930 [Polyangiaceae bacterium]|nr:hypothetical protein [Polyangiaceae bacterium]
MKRDDMCWLHRPFTTGVKGLLVLGLAASALVASGMAASGCDDGSAGPGGPGGDGIGGYGGKDSGGEDDDPPVPGADKVDLLFMVDNSASMADKQAVLAGAVPYLIDRLTNPMCVDVETRRHLGWASSLNDDCSALFENSEREFPPVLDIHIGVVTSSLGSYGTQACVNSGSETMKDDGAHLITRGIDDDYNSVPVETYRFMGFLNWDPHGMANPPGESDVATLKQNFKYMVRGAGEAGCGFEASLEAWYRFLVDPEPYARIELNTDVQAIPQGTDFVVLQQREDFLRPDSLLGIVMLTDENDCSLNYLHPIAWNAMRIEPGFRMSRSWKACEQDPLDPNCKSCWEAGATDPEGGCASVTYADEPLLDAVNMRCFDQKRRFGMDLLFPISRYVDALTKPRLPNDKFSRVFCNDVEEVYTDDTTKREECKRLVRSPQLIFLAGIVGVPWQDISVESASMKSGYRPAVQFGWTANEFKSKGKTDPPSWLVGMKTAAGQDATIWNVILGETVNGHEINPNVKPLDPLMIESIDVRTGVHPVTGAALTVPGSFGSVPNGAERNLPLRNDLQYACIFPLEMPVHCATSMAHSCDCAEYDGGLLADPVCWNRESGAYSTMQYYAKAYPGSRELAVLKGMGSQAIVASICPQNLTDPGSSDYGYRPAMDAIVNAIRPSLDANPSTP